MSESIKSQEQKALEVLRAMAQTAASGKSLTIAEDWGFGSATLLDQDGSHTHFGCDSDELGEERQFETFVDQLHGLLCLGQGLTWVKNTDATENNADGFFPRADEDGRKGGWTIDVRLLQRLAKSTSEMDEAFRCTPEEVEVVLLSLEQLGWGAVRLQTQVQVIKENPCQKS